MTDLFAAAQVEAPEAEKPKDLVRIKGGHLVHDCARCGAPNAAFGEGYSSKLGTPGTWRCWPCQKLHVAEREARR